MLAPVKELLSNPRGANNVFNRHYLESQCHPKWVWCHVSVKSRSFIMLSQHFLPCKTFKASGLLCYQRLFSLVCDCSLKVYQNYFKFAFCYSKMSSWGISFYGKMKDLSWNETERQLNRESWAQTLLFLKWPQSIAGSRWHFFRSHQIHMLVFFFCFYFPFLFFCTIWMMSEHTGWESTWLLHIQLTSSREKNPLS